MKFGRDKAEKHGYAHVELPDHADTVTIVPLSGARIPARVLESGPGMMAVAITVPIDPLGARQLQSLVIEFQGPNGRVHLTGAATVDPSDQDVLRIVKPRSIDVVQEREYVRIKSARPALVFGGAEFTKIDTCTVDISGGGFLLAGAGMLRIGDPVHFKLELKTGELPVSGTGKVVRVDARGNRGIVFDDIQDLDRRRLIRFIFEHQRSELRMGLEVERHAD
jgi:hypothetical protein